MKFGLLLLLTPFLLMCYEVSETRSTSINRPKELIIQTNNPEADDERLTDEQKKLFRHLKRNRTKRSVILRDRYRWPNGQVNYAVVSTLPEIISGVDIVIKEIEAKTCLRFNKVSPYHDVPRIMINNRREYECSAGLGYTAGLGDSKQQELNLGKMCYHLGTIRHEFQHALGVIHQQQAHDRDSFVTIQSQNIESGKESQFDSLYPDIGSYERAKYDFRSNMHYASNSFSRNTESDTIVAKDSNNHKIIYKRKNPKFSFYDLLTLNNAYGCGSHCANRMGCPGYVDKNCRCITSSDPMFGSDAFHAVHPTWPPRTDPGKSLSIDSRAIYEAQVGATPVIRVTSDIPGQGYLPNTGSQYTQLKNHYPIYFVAKYNCFLMPLPSNHVPHGMYLDGTFFDPQWAAGLGGNTVAAINDIYGRPWLFWVGPGWRPKFVQ